MKPPKERNPWEIRCQLHTGTRLEEILVEDRNSYLEERKNVLSFVGSYKSGKTFLMHLLLGCRTVEQACRLAIGYYPRYPSEEVKMRRVKVREYFGQGSMMSSSETSSRASRRNRTTTTAELAPLSRTSANMTQTSMGGMDVPYRIVEKFIYNRLDFNPFLAANADHVYPHIPSTQGVELWRWRDPANAALVLDVEGLNFTGRPDPPFYGEDDEPPADSSSEDEPAKPPAWDDSDYEYEEIAEKHRVYDSYLMKKEKNVWDAAYRTFLPPMMYAVSGIIVMVLDWETDRVGDYLEHFLRLGRYFVFLHYRTLCARKREMLVESARKNGGGKQMGAGGGKFASRC